MIRHSNPKGYKVLTKLSDEDLMVQLQAGSVDAFEILMNRYSGKLTTFLFRIVGDAELCEDLLQETFMRVFRNRHSYHNIARFSTWLYTIARNLAFSEHRRRKSRPEQPLFQVSRDQEEFEIEISDEVNSPESHTENTIQNHLLQAAMKRLSEPFREVVVLCDVQQLSYEEIAEITGLPMGTVKSRIHRGRNILHRLLRGAFAQGNSTI